MSDASLPDIPTLTTERLILRPFVLSDFEAYAEIMADTEVTRYLGDGSAVSRVDAWRQLAFILGHWQLLGYGLWAAEERASGTLMGRIGYLNKEGWPDFEVGYTLARRFWGRGFATEGARAALDFAFMHFRRERVVSVIHPENHASIRVATRLGETYDGEAELFGHRVSIYAIDRATWRARHDNEGEV